MSKGCSSVGIVGAGIQGVCIGLQLFKEKIPTTIFDHNEPGRWHLMVMLDIFLHMLFCN